MAMGEKQTKTEALLKLKVNTTDFDHAPLTIDTAEEHRKKKMHVYRG